eukprot:TRINITY_DN4796_c0_g1_i1.p1 TRINITY_DN4796_c0_g1~~TRINITY_DN4796_c0_g1_i1.p1  ORF type:complete len:230 (-),score=24.86 TRINITY_DN4796_c0_g1_i1:12-701(-)
MKTQVGMRYRKSRRLKNLIYRIFFNDDTQLLRNNPSAHQGRKRQFPHLKGNYATLFFIKVPAYLSEVASPLIEETEKIVKTKLEPTPNTGYHISLSRTFPIRIHHVELLLSLVRRELEEEGVKPFSLDLGTYSLYLNDDLSRSFLSMNVTNGKLQVCQLINILDKCLTEFKFPTFYKPAKPHASIGWTTEDLSSMQPEVMGEVEQEFEMDVREIWCKIGDQLHCIKLSK